MKRTFALLSLAVAVLVVPLAQASPLDLSPPSAAQLAQVVPHAHELLPAGPVLALATGTELAPAAAPTVLPDPETDLEAFASLVLERVVGGDWMAVGALAVVLLVWLARRYGARFLPALATDRGGAVLALVAGVVTAIVPALLAGSPLTLVLVLKGLVVGLTGAGGFSVVKRLAGASAVQKAEEAGALAAAQVGGKAAALVAIEGGEQ